MVELQDVGLFEYVLICLDLLLNYSSKSVMINLRKKLKIKQAKYNFLARFSFIFNK